jgi:hypothetical protein
LRRWRGAGAAAVLLSALLAVLLTTETPLPARDDAKAAALPRDLAKVPTDAVFLISGRVADLWNSEVAKPVRAKLAKEIEEGTRAFERSFGLPLEKVERLTMVMMDVRGPAEPLLFLRTTEAYNRDKLIAAGEEAKEEKYKGQTFYVRGKNLAVYPLDDRSLVYSNADGLRGLIDHPAPKTEGNLDAALRLAAGKHSLVQAVNVTAFNEAVGAQLPGEVEPFKPLLEARYATLTVDVGAETRADVKLVFANEKDAKAGLKPARDGLDLARAGLERGVDELGKEKEMASTVELLKQVQTSLKAAKIEQDGKTLQASALLKVDVAHVGVLLAQSVQKVRQAAARTQSSNNLKQIAIALHNYNDTYGHLPPQATYDKNGKPMLSWRVMILPFVEGQDLYKEFHLEEPWDSEHNKKLLAKMPKLYATPSDEKTLKDHTTPYQGFFGKGAFFEGKKTLSIPGDFPDGTSNTIMIVEAAKAVPWSKPDDIVYDAAKPLPKLSRPGAGGFLASMCDGSVRFLSDKITEKTMRNAITRNDGNPLGDDF